jgi:hypothetical protein
MLTVQAAAPAVQARITVSPPSALPGAVIVVAGTGFLPGELVAVRLNGTTVAQLATDGAGSFTSASFTLAPTATPGTYALSATGLTSGRTATASLPVAAPAPAPATAARLTLSPSAVSPGGRVIVSGSGFAASATVAIRLGSTIVQYTRSTVAGTFVVTMQAPSAGGSYAITATDAAARSAVATLQVMQPVVAGIGLIPNRVHRGATVLVNGDNFLPGEIVLVRFRGQIVQAASADGAGRIARVAFVVPGSTPYGASTVSISGARSGRSASATLTVVPAPAPGPRLTLSPATVHRGGTVSLSGSGFLAGETVLIRLNGGIVQAVVASSGGTFANLRIAVPVNSPYGTLAISASGARSGRTATSVLRVTPAPVAHLTATPTTVHRGGVITIYGSGFSAGEIILIRYNGAIVGQVVADSHGSFGHIKLRVPATNPYGYETVSAQGTRSSRVASARVRIVARPSLGISVSPGQVARGARTYVSGHGFAGHEVVLLRVDGILVQAAQTNASGDFSRAAVTVPQRLKAGMASVVALGSRSGRHAQTSLRIVNKKHHADQ